MKGMTNSPRKQAAARLITDAGQGNTAAVEALITDDFVLEQMERDPTTSTSPVGVRHDRASYLRFLSAVGAMTQSGMNLSIELIIEEGDNLAVFGTSNATAPSGWVYRNAYCWHLTFRGDKVAQMRDFYDTALGHRLLKG